MIPKYPFSVMLEYQERVKRAPITKAFETLAGATAMYNEHVGRQDVRRLTITLIVDQYVRHSQPK